MHGSEAGQAAPQFPLQSIDSENFQATTPKGKNPPHMYDDDGAALKRALILWSGVGYNNGLW